MIFDAGSSGSRAHVSACAGSLSMIPIPVMNDRFNQVTEPGLSSYASGSDTAGASLKPILDASVAYLQKPWRKHIASSC